MNITTKDGRTVQALTKIVSAVKIEKIELNNDNIVVQHNLPTDTLKYFKLSITTYKEGYPVLTKSILYNGRPFPPPTPKNKRKLSAISSFFRKLEVKKT